MSARQASQETGIPQQTLSRWLHDARSLPLMVPRKRRTNPWSIEEKARVLTETARLTGGDLMDYLIARKVALTSTLTIFETLTAGAPKAPDVALELLTPQLRAFYDQTWSAMQSTPFAQTNADLLG